MARSATASIVVLLFVHRVCIADHHHSARRRSISDRRRARPSSERSSASRTWRLARRKRREAVARAGQVDRDIGEDAARARPHHHDAVGQRHRLLHVVGDEEQGRPVSAHSPSRCSCRSARVKASSAENGSSSSSTSGPGTSARTIATRCAWPPDNSRGQRAGHARPGRPAAAPARPRLAALAAGSVREAEADIPRHGQPGQQPRLLEDEADAGCGAAIAFAVERDLPVVGASRPATRRSSVVLPQPEPPTIATISPAATSSEMSAARRCRSDRSCRGDRARAWRRPSWRRCPASAKRRVSRARAARRRACPAPRR